MFEEQDLVVKAIEATLGELTGGRGRCDGKAQSRLEQPSGTLPRAGPAVSPGNPETLRPLASCLLPPKPSWSLAECQGPRCAGSLVAGSSIWGGREIGSGTPAPRISWRLGVGWGLSEHPSPYDTARPPSFLPGSIVVPGTWLQSQHRGRARRKEGTEDSWELGGAAGRLGLKGAGDRTVAPTQCAKDPGVRVPSLGGWGQETKPRRTESETAQVGWLEAKALPHLYRE